jgi:hypothetical protein
MASSERPGDRPTRAVRADYAATGPEIREDGYRVVLGSECWRAPGGLVTYETRLGLSIDGSPPVTQFERGELASCPFAVAEPPIVAPPGPPPSLPNRPEELDAPELAGP